MNESTEEPQASMTVEDDKYAPITREQHELNRKTLREYNSFGPRRLVLLISGNLAGKYTVFTVLGSIVSDEPPILAMALFFAMMVPIVSIPFIHEAISVGRIFGRMLIFALTWPCLVVAVKYLELGVAPQIILIYAYSYILFYLLGNSSYKRLAAMYPDEEPAESN